MSRMHNPAHPGEVLREWIPDDMAVTRAARELQVSRVTLSKVLNGKAGISAGMALRLAAWLGTTPDAWLGMQTNGICDKPNNCPARKSNRWCDWQRELRRCTLSHTAPFSNSFPVLAQGSSQHMT